MTTSTAEIFEAIADGDLESVRALLAGDPAAAKARDENGLSAITQARYHGEDEIVDELRQLDLELDLFEAAAVGDAERASELVKGDPSLATALSPDGFTALHLAAFFGHHEIARLLIERGADVNSVAHNDMRVMPLHSAAAARQLEISELLVEHGANVNAAQEQGFRPLHEAAQNGDVELVRLLLDRGADPACPTDDGRRAADFAAQRGHQGVLDLLGER